MFAPGVINDRSCLAISVAAKKRVLLVYCDSKRVVPVGEISLNATATSLKIIGNSVCCASPGSVTLFDWSAQPRPQAS